MIDFSKENCVFGTVNKTMNFEEVKEIKLKELFYDCEIESMIEMCKDKGYKSIEELFSRLIMPRLRKYRK